MGTEVRSETHAAENILFREDSLVEPSKNLVPEVYTEVHEVHEHRVSALFGKLFKKNIKVDDRKRSGSKRSLKINPNILRQETMDKEEEWEANSSSNDADYDISKHQGTDLKATQNDNTVIIVGDFDSHVSKPPALLGAS